MHSDLYSPMRLKEASTHQIAIAMSLFCHRICVLLLHLLLLWRFISCPYGMCMPHKSQRSRGPFPSCTTTTREKNVGTCSATVDGPRYTLLPDSLSPSISPFLVHGGRTPHIWLVPPPNANLPCLGYTSSMFAAPCVTSGIMTPLSHHTMRNLPL